MGSIPNISGTSLAVLTAGAAAIAVHAGFALPLAAHPSSPHAPAADTVARLAQEARAAADEGRHDVAADRYRASAALSPELARWFRLSALQQAARAGDTAAARRDAEALRGDDVVWDDSVRLESARARFEAGDEAGGLEAARGLDGDEDPDFWVRHAGPALLAAGDTAAARRGYLAAATAPEAPAEAGRRLAELGAGWEDLAAMARADLREDREARGREFLARALEATPADEAPGLARRLAEARLDAGLESRAHGTTAEWLARGDLPAEARARLETVAARSHLRRGQRSDGETHLRRAMAAEAGDASARAGYLLADLAHGDGQRSAARERYLETARRFPRTRLGGQALMRLGFMELADGRPESAAERFRSYRGRQPDGGWALASLYWEGRALAAAGRRGAGDDLLRRAVRRDPVSYYGLLAAERMDVDPWRDVVEVAREASAERGPVTGGSRGGDGRRARGGPTPGGDGERGTVRRPGDGALSALLGRMQGLRLLGWEERALRELDAGRREALEVAGGALALAGRLHEAGWPAEGIGLGWEAFDRRGGRWSRALLEAVYPLPRPETVTAAAAGHGISPALVAAVVRQESAFDPRAVSPAGAVGLMQLMPRTAAEMAREERRPPPDETALTDPELSLELGTRYLAELLRRFGGSRPAALISYNAGPHRWLRWRDYPAFSEDRELLVERIPFGETRRYVKSVTRNVYVYRRLYDLADPGTRAGAD